MKTKPLFLFFIMITAFSLQGQEINIVFSEEQSFQNETVCVSVSADIFENMGSLQFGITWDTNILQLSETVLQELDNPNSNAVFNEITEGQLLFSWFTNNTTGLTLSPQSILFDLCFVALGEPGSNSSISISSENISSEGGQFDDGTPQLIPVLSDSGNVEIIAYPDFQIIVNPVNCNGGANGSINLSATPDNTFTYDLVFATEEYTLEDNLLIDGFLANSYPLSISFNGIVLLDTIIIIGGSTFVPFDITTNSTYNCLTNTGTIDLQVTDGTEPYSFQWAHDSDLTEPQAGNLPSGTYSVTVSDDFGCLSDTFILVQAIVPELDLGADADFCTGEIASLISNTSANTYLWSTGEVTDQIEVTETGNYALTITDENMCTATDTVQINFTPIPNVIINGPDSICLGVPISYSANEGETYTWLNAEGAFISNEASYVLTTEMETELSLIVENECFSDTAIQQIFIYPNTTVFPNDTLVLIDYPLTLTAAGGVDYLWSGNFDFSCENCPEISITPDTSNFVSLQITDENNCTYFDSLFVEVTDNVIILFDPVNIITPNGDNKNDQLVFVGLETYPNNQLKVFNRWGNIVYESLSYQNDWGGTYQGKPLPAGNYYYILTVNKTEQNLKSILTISNQ
jgi:gliding motility-associated-like protein